MRGTLPAVEILGAAVGALAVWSIVRLVNRRKKLGRKLRIALTVAILMAYPLSVGPLVWLNEAGHLSVTVARIVFPPYAPIFWLRTRGPEPLKTALDWYINSWTGMAS